MDHLLTQPLSRETEGKDCVYTRNAMNDPSFLVHVGGWIVQQLKCRIWLQMTLIPLSRLQACNKSHTVPSVFIIFITR